MLRISGGEFQGRSLKTPSSARPTLAKTRQALFNSIQFQIPGSKVLDLFAGSGILGFEALSRGAKFVVSVDESTAANRLISENAGLLKVDHQIKVVRAKVENCLKVVIAEGPFDLILADPPYFNGLEKKLLEEYPWETLLATEGRLCLEWSSASKEAEVSELPEETNGVIKIREKKYGKTILTTYQKKEQS